MNEIVLYSCLFSELKLGKVRKYMKQRGIRNTKMESHTYLVGTTHVKCDAIHPPKPPKCPAAVGARGIGSSDGVCVVDCNNVNNAKAYAA